MIGRLLTRSVLAALLVTGCDEAGDETDDGSGTGAGPGTNSAGGGQDFGGDCIAEGEQPADPCLPECGNPDGYGEPCTPDGGECSDNDKALFCTAEYSETDLWFCTGPCVADEDCGEGMICASDPNEPDSARGCFPESCS